jgi:ABC-type nitrate/sulfonate/bicarbonate transport system permease component
MSAVAALPGRLAGLGEEAQKVLLGVAGVAIVAVLWQVVAVVTANPLILPAPTAMVDSLVRMVVDPEMRLQVVDTLRRVVLGFAVGSAAGLVIGAGIGSFASVRRLLNPYLNFLRTVAPIAWIVPATIWLGVGDPSIFFVVVYAAVFPVAINTISGIAAVDKDKLRMAKAVGLSPAGAFARILVPNAVPFVLVGARLGLGLSFMVVVGAEMIIGQSGLGFIIFNARTFLDTALMFAGILVLGVVGYVMDLLFVALRTSAFRKYYAGREAE